MLEVFRRQSRSILIYVFFGIIIAVFVINFGPQSQGCGTAAAGQGVAATVGGRDLSEGAFHFGWTAMGGSNMRPERARMLRLRERIMNKLIERELFAQEAERLGLKVSERDVEELLESGRMVVLGVRQNVKGWIFKKDAFDKGLLERFVQYQLNMSLKRFVEEERREMLAERMKEILRASVKVSPEEVKRAYDQEHTRVNLEFVRFDPAQIDVPEPTDAEIAAFAKEKRKEIESYYKSHAYEFSKLQPQVKARQILIKAPKDAKPEAQKAREAVARGLLKKALEGADFAALVEKHSEDDPAARQRTLEWKDVARLGVLVEDQKKILAAKTGVVGDLLRSDEGFVILKIEAKREGDVKLEEAERDIARKLLRAERAKARAKQLAEETLARMKAGATLASLYPKKKEEPEMPATQPAPRPKKPSGPQVEETGAFERRGNVVAQIGVSAELAKAAFEAKPEKAVLDKVFEVAGGFIVARLKERQDPVPAEFEKEREEFTRRQQLQKWSEVLQAWAQKQCVATRDAGKIWWNSELLTYEGRGGALEAASFQPCQSM